jgi:UDP-N-acetylmuramate dehydrogenase
MPASPPAFIRRNEPLARYTTIGLGGAARLFAPCTTREELVAALAYAEVAELPVHVLSGGSNTIFADEGFDGLVVHLLLRGLSSEQGPDDVTVRSACGERWDDLVAYAVQNDWGGIECLSGIPGSVGATPVQNVGAYGQEVRDTIASVTALDRSSLVGVTFSADECGFAYRQSRFKREDADRFVITEVEFRLRPHAPAVVLYPELQRVLEESRTAEPSLPVVRDAVLALRRSKSMVIDSADENVRSVGSFFMNPVISPTRAGELRDECASRGDRPSPPLYPVPEGVKVSAAWLVERSGFTRGTRRGGVGISTRHSLALVNHGGTTRELLAFAAEIQESVLEKFGITLDREPKVVPFHPGGEERTGRG